MWNKLLVISTTLLMGIIAHGQQADSLPTPHTTSVAAAVNASSELPLSDSPRHTLSMVAVGAGVYGAGITGLYFLWYKDYEHSPLHTCNDSKAWLQMDKLGHSYSNYQIARGAYYGFRKTGTPENKAILLGTVYALAFFSTVEVLDGYSQHWGFSWSDMAANLGGNLLFAGQQWLWHQQRIQLKFSYTPSKYAAYRPDLLGSSEIERGLKDYNGQIYWLCASPASFSPRQHTRWPKWLNIALGYGAKGMIGSHHNPNYYDGNTMPNLQRQRQYYLSLDIDLTKIKTRSRFLRHFLVLANCLKIPFPTLEYNTEDGFEIHALMF